MPDTPENTKNPPNHQPPQTKAEARLAAALRQNLQKRKQQQRGREGEPAEPAKEQTP